MWRARWLVWVALVLLSLGAGAGLKAAPTQNGDEVFPVPLTCYAIGTENEISLIEVLRGRVAVEPLNLWASLIFSGAITHTMLAPLITRAAHGMRGRHTARWRAWGHAQGGKAPVSFGAEVVHFCGEVEPIFGLWVVPLLGAIMWFESWHTAEEYLTHGVNYAEPNFVVVTMVIAASRPILRLAEDGMARIAALGDGRPLAWWVTLMTGGPLLGSFITEPAAMTITTLLLRENFYRQNPSRAFKYATLGLLFVNVSVGGALTNFAAPPVLMVAGVWGWDTWHMFTQFGWKAALGTVASNLLYTVVFRREWARLAAHDVVGTELDMAEGHCASRRDVIPWWVTAVHVAALGWTVFTAHYMALYLGGLLALLGFS